MDRENQGLSKREKVLLLIAAVLGGGYLVWIFLLSPFWEDFQVLQQEKVQVQQEVEILEERLEQKPLIEEQLEERAEDKEELAELLPPVGAMPRVFRNLEETLEDNPVEVTSLSADGVEREEELVMVGFSLGIQSSLNSSIALLQELENFPHLLKIADISWRREDSVDLQLSGRLIFFEGDPEEEVSLEEIEEELDGEGTEEEE